MISIIISSVNDEQLQQVTKNIGETVGVPYEIIAIKNDAGELGICEVYNKGILQAQYDILCFIHEDIIIESTDWGKTLKNTFDEHADLGLIGIFGSDYKSFTPAGWHGIGINNLYANMIQSYKHSNREPLHFTNPPNSKLEFVACVDGVWLATKRQVVNEFKFDENTFKGFHCYDFDFCLAVGQKYKVAVTYEILINHLSEGGFTKEWMADNLKLHKKWNNYLPVNVRNYDQQRCRNMEKTIFREFVKLLIELKFNSSVAHKVLRNKKYKELGLYWKLKYYVVKTYLMGVSPR